MARTIGVKYKNLVKRLVVEARSKEIYGNHAIFEYVQDKLPIEIWDTWEMAYSEVDNLVSSYNMDLVHSRKG